MTKVKINDSIKVHYTGRLESGEVFDSSEKREPLEFKVGEGRMIIGFEKAVIDMELNEMKTVVLPCAEAYGPVLEHLVQEVPKDRIPEDLKVFLGQQLITRYDDHEIPVIVTNITDDFITIDANHPLAGKDLQFEIRVVEINKS